MKVSQNGKRFIKSHEGLRLCAYKADPSEKYWTVGYGHYGRDVKPGVCITPQDASLYLYSDLHEEIVPVLEDLYDECIGVKQQEIDAMASAVYNLGSGFALDASYSTFAKRMNSKEARSFTGRCRVYRDELPKWVKAGGVTLPGLVERRKHEVRLACRGKYT